MKSDVARTADEAARLAESFGTPVVMKVMSADVVHKYDAGGVLLNIHGAEEARAAYDKIYGNVDEACPAAKIQGILVEQMAPKGVEVILGASRDPRFGPLMMFGLGGTLVEVLKDVSFRLAPDVADFGRADGPRNPLLQDLGRLPRHPALRRRRHRRDPAAAFGNGLQPPGDFRAGHQPVDRPPARPGLLGGRQPRHAAAVAGSGEWLVVSG